MLPQDGFSAVGAGVASLGLTAVAAFVWFLMQQGAFGVKTLYPGDHAVRTLFGRPVRYHKSPKSLVFIAIVFDLHKVSSYRNVHDPVKMDLVIGDTKVQVSVLIHSFVDPTEAAVKLAIFNLGDSARSHEKVNARTRLVEQYVKRELAVRARVARNWEFFETEGLADTINPELRSTSGSYVEWVQLTDVAQSEAQIVGTAVNALKP